MHSSATHRSRRRCRLAWWQQRGRKLAGRQNEPTAGGGAQRGGPVYAGEVRSGGAPHQALRVMAIHMSGRVCRALLHRSTILKSGVITDDGCKEQRSAEHQERSLDGTLWRIVISAPKTATLWCIARTKLCFYLHSSATEDLPPPHGRSGSGKRKGHRVQRYESRTTQTASAVRAADGCREETAVLPSLLWCS